MLLAGVTRIDGYAGLQPVRYHDYSKETTWRLCKVSLSGRDSTIRKRQNPQLDCIFETPLAFQMIEDRSAAIAILRGLAWIYCGAFAHRRIGCIGCTESYDPGWESQNRWRGAESPACQGRLSGLQYLLVAITWWSFSFRPGAGSGDCNLHLWHCIAFL